MGGARPHHTQVLIERKLPLRGGAKLHDPNCRQSQASYRGVMEGARGSTRLKRSSDDLESKWPLRRSAGPNQGELRWSAGEGSLPGVSQSKSGENERRGSSGGKNRSFKMAAAASRACRSVQGEAECGPTAVRGSEPRGTNTRGSQPQAPTPGRARRRRKGGENPLAI